MAKHVNVVKLRGTVESLQDDLLTMKCLIPQRRNQPNGPFYENILPVSVADMPKSKLRGLVGKRMEIVGRIVNLPVEEGEQPKSTFKPFKDYFNVVDTPGDLNLAEVVGIAPSGVTYNDPKPGLSAFSNILMMAGDTFIWAVVFKTAARLIKLACPRGSLLKVGGRLNFREYNSPTSGWRQVYEVVADPEQIEVLKKAEIVDELADIRDLGAIDVDEEDGETAPDGAI